MGTLGQLSELQRSFVQFCSVLQELILNHEVAHSVVQSLHDDLPTLQPDQPGTKAQLSTNTISSAPAVSSSLASKPDLKLSAAHRLKHMAPRLTPTAADTALDPTAAAEPSYRLTVEVQDNFIVLQNATSRSRELLARLTRLRAAALAALTRQGETRGMATTEQRKGQLYNSAAVTVMQIEEDHHGRHQATDFPAIPAFRTIADEITEEQAAAAITRTELASMVVDLGQLEHASRSHVDVDMDMGDVEVDVELWDPPPYSTFEQRHPPPSATAVLNGPKDAADIVNSLGVRMAGGCGGEGGSADTAGSLPGRPALALGGIGEAAAAAATGPVVGGTGTGVAAAPGAVAGAVERAAVLSGGELVVLMGELVREAALEVEVLGHVAAAVDLTSPSEELYVYGTLLKLQPYLDERVLGAALGQRDLLLPPTQPSQPAAVAAKPRHGGQQQQI